MDSREDTGAGKGAIERQTNKLIHVDTVRAGIAAFLREWANEIKSWDMATPSNLYFAANLENTADELEGK